MAIDLMSLPAVVCVCFVGFDGSGGNERMGGLKTNEEEETHHSETWW